MSETMITRSSLATPSQVGRNEALRASAQSNRIARLSQPSAALQDMQEEVSFAFGEKLEKRNADKEKAQERSQKLLKEFVKKIHKGNVVDDKTREPLERKIERHMQSLSKHEDFEAAWQKMKGLSGDKATLFAAFDALGKRVGVRGDEELSQRYAGLAERCALVFEAPIRASINLGTEMRAFAEQHDVAAEKILDAYRASVADYSGILRAALDLTETLGLEKSEAGAAFIRQSAGKEIAMLEPSVSPEQLLHVLAELKGLQVLATVKEQVLQHREAMAKSEAVEVRTRNENSETGAQAKVATPKVEAKSIEAKSIEVKRSGIASMSAEDLVKGVFHSAVAPHSFAERLDAPASRAYGDSSSGLVRHFQGLHKIFKALPEYAFVGRIEKQRALLPLETRLDALVAQERASSREAVL